jgi:predicted nucleic acid-binding protein
MRPRKIMRIVVDIPEKQIKELTEISQAEKVPRRSHSRSHCLLPRKEKTANRRCLRLMERPSGRWLSLSGTGAVGMVSALFDTDILTDYLNGIEQAKAELEKYSDKAISVITWMEVMVGATPETEAITRNFLNAFDTLPIENQVCEVAVKLRKKHKIKLPDAIVWATAQIDKRILVTRNTKDFSH